MVKVRETVKKQRSTARRAVGWQVRRRQAGATSAEYLLVLALVVLPIALMSPMLLRMIATYAQRIFVLIRMPLG